MATDGYVLEKITENASSEITETEIEKLFGKYISVNGEIVNVINYIGQRYTAVSEYNLSAITSVSKKTYNVQEVKDDLYEMCGITDIYENAEYVLYDKPIRINKRDNDNLDTIISEYDIAYDDDGSDNIADTIIELNDYCGVDKNKCVVYYSYDYYEIVSIPENIKVINAPIPATLGSIFWILGFVDILKKVEVANINCNVTDELTSESLNLPNKECGFIYIYLLIIWEILKIPR